MDRRGAAIDGLLRVVARGRPHGAELVLHLELVATIYSSAPGSAPHSMIVIEDEKHFQEVVAHAKAIGLYEGDKNDTLKNRLDYLAGYGGKTEDGSDKTRVRLFKDFAPYSFGFVIEAKNADGSYSTWFHGGLIFHGAHDGNGGSPTLAVTLAPVTGWSIHT